MSTKLRSHTKCFECKKHYRNTSREVPLICASHVCDEYTCRSCYVNHLAIHEMAGDPIFSGVFKQVQEYWDGYRERS